jgi:ABC-type nitrate/sulfonate/bicarbonate transport system substrate-binding protein
MTRKNFIAGLLVAAFLSGCSPTSNPSNPPSESPSVAASPSVAPSASVEPATVRLALDWTPNTDHTGFYVARSKGWYTAAGIDLQILPYATVTPETLLATHQAECGISFQDALTIVVAKGADIVSVAAILQKTASAIAVLADGPIERPRDLDGKLYAGFGYPADPPTLKAVIQADGGKGNFEVATLDTAAYEALYNKRADFTIVFTAWEGVEAHLRGIGLRYFQLADFGFPQSYQVVLACDRQWLEREPDAAQRFISATVKGFQFGIDDPATAADILVKENPGIFDANPQLPKASQKFLVDGGYLADADHPFGSQTLERWQGYSGFLYDHGILTDADGKPLTAPLDYGSLFTNEFLE